MSRFVVALNDATKEEQDAVTNYLRENKWGWWHYIQDVWLLHDVPDSVTSREIGDAIDNLVSKKRHLILRIPENQEVGYWGRSPEAGWEWINNYFKGRAGK